MSASHDARPTPRSDQPAEPAVAAERCGPLDALLPLVYDPLVDDQLHALARHQRRCWDGDETLDTTALVHETYLRRVHPRTERATDAIAPAYLICRA